MTLILIGLLGGLITGISPCILPVLPVVFFAGGSQNLQQSEPAAGAKSRPYRVIAGLVVSFTLFTLLGSLLINALSLPQDILRTVGLVVLVLVGLGLIFPKLDEILEKPFAKLPTRQTKKNRSGFGLGLGLGLLYVPCAGPVLTAITVASATGHIGVDTVALTCAFAIGATFPLLIFALAGQRISSRIAWVRRHNKGIRRTGGVVMILLAVALAFNVTDIVQRAVPNYTQGLQQQVEDSPQIKGFALSGLDNGKNTKLANCDADAATTLADCGPAPEFSGITKWLNSSPLTMKSLRGKVVLVDFWTYSCINCQRSLPHIEQLDKTYKKYGLQVVGVHSPEFPFEKSVSNVERGAKQLGVEYPIAMDNDLSTFTDYRNRYWPGRYLIDATGTVRYIKLGEGQYDTTENLVRQLLTQRDATVKLPAPSGFADTSPTDPRTSPETYLGTTKASTEYVGDRRRSGAEQTLPDPGVLQQNQFGFSGAWRFGDNSARAVKDAEIHYHYGGRGANLVLGGTGTATVVIDGNETKTIQVNGNPRLYPLNSDADFASHVMTVKLSPGVEAYSFTFD